jgi:hypothetical protein
MEVLESMGWLALGFIPVFGAMEIAWKFRKIERGKASFSTYLRTKKKMSFGILHSEILSESNLKIR